MQLVGQNEGALSATASIQAKRSWATCKIQVVHWCGLLERQSGPVMARASERIAPPNRSVSAK
jgi:hypothetical protein